MFLQLLYAVLNTRFIVIIFVHVEEEKYICCNEKFVTSQLAKKVLKHSLLTAPGKKAISGITATTYTTCVWSKPFCEEMETLCKKSLIL